MDSVVRLPLGDYMRNLEKARGLPEGYLARTRAIESSNGTNTVNPNSSARGDFQFIRSTAKKYGVNVADPFDSARGAADLAADNSRAFRSRFGATPTGADLYGMHQQGSAGYAKLLSGERTGTAEMGLNGGANLTAAGMVNRLAKLYSNAKPGNLEGFTPSPIAAGKPVPDGANAGQGPTVERAASLPPTTPAAPERYTGGIMGLLQGDDYTGAGASKGLTDKLGDLTNSNAFGTALKGLAAVSAPQQQAAPGITLAPPQDNVHVPNMALLPLLRRRGMMGVG